jgi:hypothetical protein
MGLGALSAKLTGKDAVAGAMGGLVESALGNILDANGVSVDRSSSDERFFYSTGSMLTAGIVADLLGKDPVTAAEVARNAAENNYLKYNEALEYEKLKDSEDCGSECVARMAELERLDVERNVQLTACEGNNSPECNAARMEVQIAAAEYLLQGKEGGYLLDGKQGTRYIWEQRETISYADQAIGRGMVGGTASSLSSLGKGVLGMGEWALTHGGGGVLGWVLGGSFERMQQDAEGLKQMFSSEDAFISTVGFGLSEAERIALAEAYIMGDVPTINQIFSDRSTRFTMTVAPSAAGVAGKFGRGASAASQASKVVTVYRVEGLPNTRILIGEGGQVAIQGDQMLFLNFGDKVRAEQFFATRLQQGMLGVEIKSFQVPQSFLEELRAAAVPESMAKQFPGRPLLVDPTKAPNQFGLRPEQIEALQQAIIKNSGKAQ